MARQVVALGADAERARLLAADRTGVPWRRWRPDHGDGDLPALGIRDTGSGLRLGCSLSFDQPLADGTQPHDPPVNVRFLSGTPTASFVEILGRYGADPDAGPGCDVLLTMAKRGPEDVLIRVATTNRDTASVRADLCVSLSFPAITEVVPQGAGRSSIRLPWEAVAAELPDGTVVLCATHAGSGSWWLAAADAPALVDDLPEDASAATLRYELELAPGGTRVIALRLSRSDVPRAPVGPDAAATLGTRAREAVAFHASLLPADADDADRRASREALAALLFGPAAACPVGGLSPATFAALALALADPTAARDRLLALVAARTDQAEGPLEPPIDAWAALRIHELAEAATGLRDHRVLERVFRLLLEDYSRWVDRVDPEGRNALLGGIIGLDGMSNSAAGTFWMGCYSIWMLSLAVELARDDPTYHDVAVTFLDTSLAMIAALDDLGGSGSGSWDDADGQYHDTARDEDGTVRRLPGRSAVGLVPLVGLAVIPREALARSPEVSVRLNWSMRHQPELAGSVVRASRKHGATGDALVSLVPIGRRAWALHDPGSWRAQLSPQMIVLLVDALDGVRAFERRSGLEVPGDRGARSLSALVDALPIRSDDDHDRPPWVAVLAGVMRRAR